VPTILEGLGTEEVLDEVFNVMYLHFNDELAVQQDVGNQLDADRATLLGVGVPTVELEPVDSTPKDGFPYGNFHIGSIPSFVQTEDRVANYPMLVVAPGRTIPDPENVMTDQYDVFQNGVSIHCFARASLEQGVEMVYRRVMRMAEAVHNVVNSTSLRRIVAGTSGPILVDRSEPWRFPHEDGHGDDWYWMAVMHQYQVKNYSHMP